MSKHVIYVCRVLSNLQILNIVNNSFIGEKSYVQYIPV